MKIATSELEHLREEVKNCHHIIKDLQKKREFVGLTGEERGYLYASWRFDNTASPVMALIQHVEAKLKELNT
jgi:hypothetical protein